MYIHTCMYIHTYTYRADTHYIFMYVHALHADTHTIHTYICMYVLKYVLHM